VEGSRYSVSSDATIEAFSRMSDQGCIGQTEATRYSSGGVISQFTGANSRGRFVVGEELIVLIEDFKCEWKTFLCVTFEV
jgi:hypothetical protein